MKLDQIAYYSPNATTDAMIISFLGLQGDATLARDTVAGRVLLPEMGKEWHRSVAHLQFFYRHGVEIELLRYIEGPHWHQGRLEQVEKQMLNEKSHLFYQPPIFISHFGYHLSDDEPMPPPICSHGPMVQEMFTEQHTNPYLLEKGRTYHYRIFQPAFGPSLKFIKRIEK